MTDGSSIDGQLDQINSDLEHISNGIDAFRRRVHNPDMDRAWAAMTLATNVATWGSILAGRQVYVANLHPEPLRHALRNTDVVVLNPDHYLLVTNDMLDAIVEAGPCPNRDAS